MGTKRTQEEAEKFAEEIHECNAFPMKYSIAYDEVYAYSPGLTKRELFAAMAMQGILSNSNISIEKETPKLAVLLSDKLIEELNK